MQKPRESEGLGRQDSSGHLTLNLLPSSTTQLLAATRTAMPGPPAAGVTLSSPCAADNNFLYHVQYKEGLTIRNSNQCIPCHARGLII